MFKLFDTLIGDLKEFFENINFEKNSLDGKKSMHAKVIVIIFRPIEFPIHVDTIWASTRENRSGGGEGNNKGADQPAYPRSLISAFDFYLLERIIS